MPSESAILLQPSKRLKTCRFWARFKTFCLSAFRTLAEYSSPSTCTCRKNQWCERLVFSVFRSPRDTAPLLIRADSRTHRLETRNRGETQRRTGRDAATRQEICQQRQVALQMGRQLKQHRTELACFCNGSKEATNFDVTRITLRRRLMCVMVWCALTANLKPGGVAAIQSLSSFLVGRLRKV